MTEYDGTQAKTVLLSARISRHLTHYKHATLCVPFAIPPHQRKAMAAVGIWAPDDAPDGRHAALLALERAGLDEVSALLRRYTQHGLEYGTMFLRESKIQDFRFAPTVRYNPLMDHKDLFRYDFLTGPSRLPDDLPPVMFMHDTLPRLSPRAIGRLFDTRPTLQHLICTAVIPFETLTKEASFFPDLYQIDYEGEVATFLITGDEAGSYEQPVGASVYLKSNTLVTDQDRCIHVSLVNSRYAHHIIVFSREEIIPRTYNYFSMGDLVQTSPVASPLVPPRYRLTDRACLDMLRSYHRRNAVISEADLWMKATAWKNSRGLTLPNTQVEAAVRQVMFERILSHRTGYNVMWDWWLLLTLIFQLPFYPPTMLYHMWSHSSFWWPFAYPKGYKVELTPCMVHYCDSPWLTKESQLCPARADDWWIPPLTFNGFGCWVRLVHLHAVLASFVLVKVMVADIVWPVAKWSLDSGLQIVSGGLVALDATPARLVLLIIGLVIVNMFAVFDLRFFHGLTQFWMSLPARKGRARIVSLLFVLFGTPNSRYKSNAGHGPLTQLFLGFQIAALLSPRLQVPYMPLYPSVTRISSNAWNLLSLGLLFSVLAEQLLIYFIVHAPIVPRPHHNGALGLEPLPANIADEERPPPDVIPPDGPGGPPAAPPGAPPPIPPIPLPGLPAGPPAPNIPQPPPPMVIIQQPGGNLAPIYAIPHAGLTLQQFRQVANALPIPVYPGILLNGMCVWDCLGQLMGVAPLTLYAIFAAWNPAVEATFVNGAVPLAQLDTVLGFWPIGLEVWVTTANYAYNAGDRARFVNAPAPDWGGTSTLALYAVQGSLHLEPATIFPSAQGRNLIQNAGQNTLIQYSSRAVDPQQIPNLLRIPLENMALYNSLDGTSTNPHAVATLGPAGLAAAPVQALPPFVQLPTALVQVNSFQYTTTPADREAAKRLTADLKQHSQELKARHVDPDDVAMSLNEHAKHMPYSTVEYRVLQGVGGAGKSHWIKQQIPIWAAANVQMQFHTWNPALRRELQIDLTPVLQAAGVTIDERMFCTGWIPWMQQRRGVIVFDDAGLLPANALLALQFFSPALDMIVCTMDPAQAQPAFAQAESMSRADQKTADWLTQKCQTYSFTTWRPCLENANLFGLPRACAPGAQIKHGGIGIVSAAPKGVPVLAASPRFAEGLVADGQDAMPFRYSQGAQWDQDIAVHATSLAKFARDHTWCMLLLRAQRTVWIIVEEPVQLARAPVVSRYGDSMIANAIFAVAARRQTAFIQPHHDPDRLIARAFQWHFANCLSDAALAGIGVAPRPQMVAGEFAWQPDARAYGTQGRLPFMMPGLQATGAVAAYLHRPEPAPIARPPRDESHEKAEVVPEMLRHKVDLDAETLIAPVPGPSDPPPLPVDARAPYENFADPLPPPEPLDRDARERPYGTDFETQQVRQDGSPHGLTHSTKDVATESITFNERLPVGEAHITPDHRALANKLFAGLRKFVGWRKSNETFDEGLFERCVNERIRGWADKKTLADIRTSLSSAPADQDRYFTDVFLKNQRIRKLPKRESPATKGQSVTNVAQIELFQSSVWALYILRKLQRHKKGSVYLHTGQSFLGMEAWYKANWTEGAPMTGNDVTGWDTGVNEAFTLALRRLVVAFGMPEEFAEAFVDLRLNARTFKGPLKPSQKSGDPYTWLVNTVSNLMYIGAASDLTGKEPICVSGDDVLVNAHTEIRSLPGLTFVNKTEHGRSLEFCGFLYGGPKLRVSPRVVAHTGQIGFEDGRSDVEFWDSYQERVAYARGDTEPDESVGFALAINQFARRFYHLPPPPEHLRVSPPVAQQDQIRTMVKALRVPNPPVTVPHGRVRSRTKKSKGRPDALPVQLTDDGALPPGPDTLPPSPPRRRARRRKQAQILDDTPW
jgi:hypothetical protein